MERLYSGIDHSKSDCSVLVKTCEGKLFEQAVTASDCVYKYTPLHAFSVEIIPILNWTPCKLLTIYYHL